MELSLDELAAEAIRLGRELERAAHAASLGRSSREVGYAVSARFLPQRLVLDAGDNVWLGDEVVEEAVPLFDGPACGCEHITYLV
ncbi:MAG: hypothetical protein RLP08_26245, partial [Marinovum algicola]|uniref:hypothetical protein n=1 Tax=Marinovum algicola TaxID=42444 RepID=UPI0032F06284